MSDERIERAKRIASGLKEINEVLRQNLPQPEPNELLDDQYQLINKIRDAAPNSEVSLRVNVDDFLAGDPPPKT